MVTSEDTIMVRTIEKKLNAQIERRTIEGFDYNIPAPHKDSEFARPPREPQMRRKKPDMKTGAQDGKPHHAGQKPASRGTSHPHARPASPSSVPAARHPQRAPRAR
jgi:ATP-dependent RNA helicase RhlE